MSAETKPPQDEGFLGRWSRRKTEARSPDAAAPQDVPPTAAEEAPDLPPVDELTLDSDFRGFLHPKVDENVRRAALRKLFSDPHFNVMDGLDTYIDDYSQTEPIPPEMLAGLRQAQRILNWAEGKDDENEKDDAAEHLADVPSHGDSVPPADAPAQQPATLESAPTESPADALPAERALAARDIASPTLASA
jgi:hypothetical protein